MKSADDSAAIIEKLHRQFAGVIYDLCLQMLQDHHEAQDAVQETFIGAFRSLSSFVYGESHLPWLYKIATNVCLKIIRTRRRKGVALMEDPARAAAPLMDPVTKINVRRALEELIGELDERGMEILTAYYIAGMNQGQIAASLGISRRAVVKRLTKLRARAEHIFGEL